MEGYCVKGYKIKIQQNRYLESPACFYQKAVIDHFPTASHLLFIQLKSQSSCLPSYGCSCAKSALKIRCQAKGGNHIVRKSLQDSCGSVM